MYTPNSKPAMATYEINKAMEKSAQCINTRICLLVWAYLRLMVSILWTGILLISVTLAIIDLIEDKKLSKSDSSFQSIGILALIPQSIEIGMIIMFIIAGHKKSGKLYRVYYKYCIVTLVIYIFAVIQGYLQGYLGIMLMHNIIEIYITYHFDDLFVQFSGFQFAIVFGVVAVIDICLEIFLIRAVKKLSIKYTDDIEDQKTGQSV